MGQPVSILTLALGANDALRGIDPADTKKNLVGIIAKARGKYPNIRILLAGMEAPPNLGAAYAERFRAVYREIAQEEGVVLLPFLLEGVGGHPELNLPDGIHPTPEGHQIVADNVWSALLPMLDSSPPKKGAE